MKTPKPLLSIAFVLIMVIAHDAIAQQGNVSAGGSISGTGGSMSYSVGQTDYLHYTSETASISFGLQQAWVGIPGVPPFLDVPGTTIAGGESLCFNATGTVIFGGSGKEFIVEEGGHADVIAGERIVIKYGTRVKAGGSLHARISGEWCFPIEDKDIHPLAIVYDDAPAAEALPTTPADESLLNPLFSDSKILFRVYPNPGRGIFTVEFTAGDTDSPAFIKVLSIMGELIATIDDVTGPGVTINISDTKPGVYLLRVSQNNRVGTEIIIKQ